MQANPDRYWEWLQDPAAQARWNTAQAIRHQLQACMEQAAQYQQKPVPPAQKMKCDYKTFEGFFQAGGDVQIQNLLAGGYKVGIEYGNTCRMVTDVPIFAHETFVKIAGYRCQ
jgi:hypothetical protein